jgi:protein arginine kinase activator
MKCEKCGIREAEVHIRHQKGKETDDFHLCRQCAEDMAKDGLLPDVSFEIPLDNFPWGLFSWHGSAPSGPDADASPADQRVCSHCGLDHSSFRKTGKFGCPDCFTAFQDDLAPLFRKIHGSDIHRGTRPQNACGDETSPEDLEYLRKELREAVEKEEYERAAIIRDRIREIGECHEGEG